MRGNERGLARLERAKEILDEIGLGGDRLDIFFMSGSQGHAYAMAAQTMTERIRKLGPNPLRSGNGKLPQAAQPGEAEEDEGGFRGRRG